jgi:hypothetical protein
MALAAAVAGVPAAALADPADVAATQSYVQANYALVRVAGAHLATSEAAPLGALAQVQRECPRAGAGSPQDPESTQMSDEVIGAMVIAAARPDLQAIRDFIATVGRLRWSNHRLASTIQAYVGKLKTLSTLAAPELCADVRAWAANGFQTLPASTVRFDQRFMPAWVALGELPASLAAYESPAEGALVRRSNQLEAQLTDGEARAVESWGRIMNALVLNP